MGPITPVSYDGFLIPSFSQRRFLASHEWARHMFPSGPPSEHLVEGISISGECAEEAVEEALNRIVARHAGLRSAFPAAQELVFEERTKRLEAASRSGIWPEGLHRQVVVPEVRVPFRQFKIQPESLWSAIRRENLRAFDFAKAPLLRATLFDLGDNSHVLLLVAHHLVADAASLEIVWREFREFYRELVTGVGAQLRALTVHSPDLGEWERRELPSSRSLDFWKDRWPRAEEGQISYSDLPVPRSEIWSRPPTPGYEQLVLPAPIVESLRAGARRANVSLSSFLLAALGTVLHLWTERPVTSIWTNFPNRGQPEILDVIGWLGNGQFVALDFSGNPQLDEIIQRAHETVLEAERHQEIPFCFWTPDNGPAKVADCRITFALVTETGDQTAVAPGTIMSRLPLAQLRQLRFPAGLEILGIDRGSEMLLLAGYIQNRLPAIAVKSLLEAMSQMAEAMAEEPAVRPGAVLAERSQRPSFSVATTLRSGDHLDA
jgi:Condensation domain